MKDFFKDFLEGCWLLCVALVIATVLVLTFFYFAMYGQPDLP